MKGGGRGNRFGRPGLVLSLKAPEEEQAVCLVDLPRAPPRATGAKEDVRLRACQGGPPLSFTNSRCSEREPRLLLTLTSCGFHRLSTLAAGRGQDDRTRPHRAVRVGGRAESRATTPAPNGPQTRVSALELGVPARRGCRRKMPCVVWLVNDRCSTLSALEAGRPRSRRRQTRCPAGPTPWLADGSLSPTPGRRAEGASWVFFFTPFMGAPAPWPSCSPRAPLTLPQTDAGGRHGPAVVLDFLSTRDSLSPSALTLRARSKSIVAWGSCGLGNQGRRTRRLSTTPPSSRA